jgi:putative tricarboxylic transport membrane protein
MEVGLLQGFALALKPINLWYAFLGSVLGTIVGVLPGLGPAATMAILLPVTGYLPPAGAIIMMAGIYYGAMYGGSTTSILLNVPGEAASVPTCVDGFQMAKKGRAGEALFIAAVGSFIAGTAGTILLSFFAPVLADFSLRFGPPEYTSLTVFSLLAIASFTGRSLLRGVIMSLFGMFLATVGLDSLTGHTRLVFHIPQLYSGVDLVPVLMGLFGVAEIMSALSEGTSQVAQVKLGKMIPRGEELRKGLIGSIKGTIVGLFGWLPGMLGSVSAFISYDLAKRTSSNPEEYGSGSIEGVAAPEAANNAAATTGFIPLMALGVPTAPVYAILLSALLIYGLPTGPLLFQQHGEIAWTIIASFYIGNVMLLVLNLPLVGLWARITLIPYRLLGPFVLAIVVVGAYSLRNNFFDVSVTVVFGMMGYLMRKRDWPATPLILGMILGDLLERNLRAAMQMSGGSPLILLEKPISATLLGLSVLIVLVSRWLLRAKKVVTEEIN